jgi:catalase
MAMGDNGGDALIISNSFDNITPDPAYKPFEEELDSAHVAFFDRNKMTMITTLSPDFYIPKR